MGRLPESSVIERWRVAPPAVGALAWLAIQGPLQPRFPFRSRAAIERAQRRRIAAAIRHAYRNVPFYRETMKRLGLSPSDIKAPSDLARLPLLERADLQRDPERFVSDALPREKLVELQTGGTLGAPITVHHDSFALLRAAAYHQRAGTVHRKVAGRHRGFRMLGIGHLPDPAQRRQHERWLARLNRLAGQRRRGVSILDPVERTVEELNRFQPDLLVSFGSYLEELFVHLHASGQPFHHPSVLVHGGDAITVRARELISGAFGIPIFGVYGSYEAITLGFECTEHAGYHLNVDLYPARVVDGEGRDLPAGERGELVISNLVNRGTVLLNYRLGDLIARRPGDCPCGRALPLFTFVEGRVADWLVMPSGERLHAQTVAVVLDVEPEILRYQVVQVEPARLEVKLVTTPGADREALVQQVEQGFAELLGSRITTTIRFVDDLPRTPRGKVRTVIGLNRAQADLGEELD